MIHVHPGMPQPTRFIDPVVLTKISSLELVARIVVEGFISGLHRSPHLGFSVNFAEYRPYHQGDDIRKIDWKVFARLDRFFIKEYEGETNTNIQLILDCSHSMAYGSRGISKLQYGQFLAASLGYFGFKQRDGVGFVSFDENVVEFVPPRGSIGHLNTVLHSIERTQAGQKTNILKPLVDVAERLRRRGIIIVISDLLDEPQRVMDGVRRLACKGNDVTVFQVLDPAELDFDFPESAQFIDMETRAEMHIIPEYVRREYCRIIKDQVAYYERECQKDRIDFAMVNTMQPLDHALFTYLLRREQAY